VAVALLAGASAANAEWADPQAVCTNCTEADGIVSFAEAPSGAAVMAWHGNQRSLAAYRAPGASTFGTPVTVASGGKPEFVRAAIGSNGTAAVVTWIPSVPNSQVIRTHGSTGGWSAPVVTPAQGAGPHIAVGPDGSVTMIGWVAASPTDQSLQAFALAPGATTFSGPTIIDTLAAPYTSQAGITLAGNGRGDILAGWTLLTGVAATTQAFTSFRPVGGAFGAREPVGTAPSSLSEIALDEVGNAVAAHANNSSQGFASYRSYLDDSWQAPAQLPRVSGGSIGFDGAGNAGLLSSANNARTFVRRAVGDGALTPQTLPAATGADLSVSEAGDAVAVGQNGTSLTSRWSSTLSPTAFSSAEALPGSGTRPLIGVGTNSSSLATAGWATTSSGSTLGTVRASTRPAGSGGDVTLTAQQLLISQRISQAAVLRSNGTLDALSSGLPSLAFRNGGLGPPAFGPGVPTTGAATPAAPSNSLGYEVPIPSKSGGDGDEVTLTAQQLLINQRISQAAVLRSNAVRDRLDDGLTAAQIAAGAITAAKLRPGLAFGPLGAASAGTPITVPKASGGSGKVTLTAQQLLINQRISQAAVRRSNLSIARIQAGLTLANIASGGISSQNVSP
jgi:hypothetical protein